MLCCKRPLSGGTQLSPQEIKRICLSKEVAAAYRLAATLGKEYDTVYKKYDAACKEKEEAAVMFGNATTTAKWMAGKLNTLNLEMTAALSAVIVDTRKDFGSDNDDKLKGIDLNYGKSC